MPVIAYPTETVYGLGCDPLNEGELQRILSLKNRPVDKGMIVIAASFEQLAPFVGEVSKTNLQNALRTWPGPVTWIFPAKAGLPELLTGGRESIAVRVSAHPIVQQLCQTRGPLVSTSANLSGEPACKTTAEVEAVFAGKVDEIIPGACGAVATATPIYDVLTGKQLR